MIEIQIDDLSDLREVSSSINCQVLPGSLSVSVNLYLLVVSFAKC